jgi:uncharacterized integral membrane protein
VRLILSGVVAVWIGAIALIAAQNGTPISLQFLMFQSVSLPFGLMLAFCAMAGLLGTAALLFIWEWASR